MAANRRSHGGFADANQKFELTGLADVQYLIAERKGSGEQVQKSRAAYLPESATWACLWLATPAPIGSLNCVSKEAGAVAAFVSKNPADMLDDVLNLANSSDGNASANIARGESELKIRFHQDLADTLGGEGNICPGWAAASTLHRGRLWLRYAIQVVCNPRSSS